MIAALIETVEHLLEQLVTGAVPPPRATVIGPELEDRNALDQFLPTLNTVTQLFATFTRSQREQAIRDRLRKLRSDRDILTDSFSAAQIDLIGALSNAESLAQSLPDQNPFGAPLEGARDLARGLRLSQASTVGTQQPEQLRTERANRLLRQADGEAVVPAFDPTPIFADARDSARLMIELRCLHTIYARLAIALRIHIATEAPLARIFALWRTEGDLMVPPSWESLRGEDVPRVSGQAIELPAERTNFQDELDTLRPHLATGVWLAQRVRLTEPQPLDLATVGDARALAYTQYHLALIGLDILFDDALRVDRDGALLTQRQWLGLNWQRAGQALNDAEAEAATAHTQLADALTPQPERRPTDPAQPEAWFVVAGERNVTVSYIAFAAGVVGEGVRYLSRLRRDPPFLSAGAPPLSEMMAYVAYQTWPTNTRSFLASAMAHARRGNTPHARALRAALQAANIPDLEPLLDSIVSASDDQAIALAAQHWTNTLQPAVEQGDTLAAIERFIQGAGDSEWPSWHVVRRNVVRYHRLYTYYVRLFPMSVYP